MLARTNDAEFDTGPGSSRAGGERYCVVTRSVKPVTEMIRFVAGPDGVVPDLKRRLPGRGVWVTASRAVLSDAVRRKVFARPFGQDARVPTDLAVLTERLLEHAAFDALAVARKARLVVTGFSKVEAALAGEDVAALIHAADAAADGVRKLSRAASHRNEHSGIGLPIIQTFKSAQLDLALGRSNVVHAALLAGRASATFLARGVLLARFREDGSGRERSLLCTEVRGLGSE